MLIGASIAFVFLIVGIIIGGVMSTNDPLYDYGYPQEEDEQ